MLRELGGISIGWRTRRLGALLLLGLLIGCSRTHYRVATDRNAYDLLAEKSVAKPWQVPAGFNILPNPMSRFFDPTSIEHPVLPPPSPHLYAYPLPVLAQPDA